MANLLNVSIAFVADGVDVKVQPTKKKGPIGYLLFAKHNRAETKAMILREAANLSDDIKGTVPAYEVSKKLGKLWRELSEEERKSWTAKAAAQ